MAVERVRHRTCRPSASSTAGAAGSTASSVGVLAVFALVSVWVLAIDVWRVAFDGAVWTGTDGVYIVDQMQYLAWIQDASHHFLVVEPVRAPLNAG